MDPSRTPGLGASGAVNAIMLLDMFLNPKATLYFDFIIPVPAMLLGIFLIGKDILRIIEVYCSSFSSFSSFSHTFLKLVYYESCSWWKRCTFV